ncbi:hypothetical protein [Gottfriedia acidiceleris]|uniref:Uncharacterized protein n=1 Tax=Gottfriedia acidiceleris TaxID=371036 RepID=A0ABY4JI45_9BACI|nr:hypothetical protein [Gottfriedia acidiceleris]UPM53504.1 hypothetical protein MY490_17165 [Gottfriedia acidiceleris]
MAVEQFSTAISLKGTFLAKQKLENVETLIGSLNINLDGKTSCDKFSQLVSLWMK